MKLALALDTSGPVGSVALVGTHDDGHTEVLGGETICRGMRHGVELFPALERVLRQAGVEARSLDLVAVGTGPGSYTGLRVGITAARALAYAAGVALLGVPSCDAWARATPVEDGGLVVALDAKVRAVYLAVYEQADGAWSRTVGPDILDPAEAASRVPPGALLVGDAVEAFPEAFDGLRRSQAPDHADAEQVAWIALARHESGERRPIDDVVPLYLRKTEAERKWESLRG